MNKKEPCVNNYNNRIPLTKCLQKPWFPVKHIHHIRQIKVKLKLVKQLK